MRVEVNATLLAFRTMDGHVAVKVVQWYNTHNLPVFAMDVPDDHPFTVAKED